MKILVISDIHDRVKALRKALIDGKVCEAIIFCGDTSSPETFSVLIEDGRPLYAVLGNMEFNEGKIIQLAHQTPHVSFDRDVLKIIIDNKNIVVTHYPDMAEELAEEGIYDTIFHGHSHLPRNEIINGVLIANPGEIAGYVSGKLSFGIYDTKTNLFEILDLNSFK